MRRLCWTFLTTSNSSEFVCRNLGWIRFDVLVIDDWLTLKSVSNLVMSSISDIFGSWFDLNWIELNWNEKKWNEMNECDEMWWNVKQGFAYMHPIIVKTIDTINSDSFIIWFYWILKKKIAKYNHISYIRDQFEIYNRQWIDTLFNDCSGCCQCRWCDGQIEFEFGWQFIFGIHAIGKVNAS